MKQEATPECDLLYSPKRLDSLEIEKEIDNLFRQGIPLWEILQRTGMPLEAALQHLWNADLHHQLADIVQGRVKPLPQPVTLTFSTTELALLVAAFNMLHSHLGSQPVHYFEEMGDFQEVTACLVRGMQSVSRRAQRALYDGELPFPWEYGPPNQTISPLSKKE